jgi:hypothetical protein
MKPSSSALFIAITLMCCISTVHYAYCFDDKKTHPELTKIAIKNSMLNSYLVNSLGLAGGTEMKISPYLFPEDKSILEWLQKGSTDEDSPMCRASTHFHNPILTWDQSYMTDAPWYIQTWCRDVPPAWPLYSNITWATGFTSRGGSYMDRDRQDKMAGLTFTKP